MKSLNNTEQFIVQKLIDKHFVLTVHARKRMDQRFVSELDIIEAASTLKSIKYQKDKDTYLLTGWSTWKEPLMVSVALRNEVIIVTVFFKDC